MTHSYEKIFLGSLGKKMTLGYSELEDFDYIEPVYENHLKVQIPSLQIDSDGSFQTLINYQQFNYQNKYVIDPYLAYLYGNQPLVRIMNNSAESKKRVLVLKDSFANTVVPFLALSCVTIDVIDLRGNLGCFDGSLKSFIKQNNYDVVLLITSNCGVGSAETINSTDSIWYFE